MHYMDLEWKIKLLQLSVKLEAAMHELYVLLISTLRTKVG